MIVEIELNTQGKIYELAESDLRSFEVNVSHVIWLWSMNADQYEKRTALLFLIVRDNSFVQIVSFWSIAAHS